jgi:hypothetical protein
MRFRLGCFRWRRSWFVRRLDLLCLGYWRRRKSRLARTLRDLIQLTAQSGDLSLQIRYLVAQFQASFIEKPARIPASHQGNDRNHRDP